MGDRRRSYRPAPPTEPPPSNIQPPLPPTTPAVTRYAGRITALEAEVERLHGVSGEYLTALEEANSENDALEARVAELTSAARELLEATDTLAIAAARHHLRRTLAAEGKGGRE